MKTKQTLAFFVALFGLCQLDNVETFAASESAESEFVTKLKEVSNGSLTSAKARRLVQAVGRSANSGYLASLKEVALSRSRTEDHLIAFDALYSLWKLGEPSSYFLENAKAFANNPKLAYYSLLILAYSPSQHISGKLPTEEQVIVDNEVSYGLAQYRRVDRTLQNYRSLSETGKKIALLEQCIRTGWNPISIEENEPTGNLNPLAVWAQSELLKLSQQESLAVAQSIFVFRPHREAKESVSESYRTYFLRSVGEETKKKYAELRKVADAEAQGSQ